MFDWIMGNQEAMAAHGNRCARKRFCFRYFSILALCVFLFASYSSLVHAQQASEYRLKVAFLYNFFIYTEWPNLSDQTLNLCIYGEDPFGENLQYVKSRKAHEREIVVRYTRNVEDLSGCQVVFISKSHIDNLSNIMKRLSGLPILTIADVPDVGQQGVILNMAIKEGKITFEANLATTKRNGLKLSSQLLRFATKVYQ